MSYRTKEWFSVLAMLVMTGFFYVQLPNISQAKATIFPFMLMVLMASLAGVKIFTLLLFPPKGKAQTVKEPFLANLGRLLFVLFSLIVYALAVEEIGFFVSSFVFLLVVSLAIQQEPRTLRSIFIRLLVTLVFLFFSDAQADPEKGDYGAFGELLTQAIAQAPQTSLALFGGDTVNDGGDADEWQAFWQAAAVPLASLTTAAVAGNHDNQALLAEQFAHPKQAPQNRDEGFFYSFDMGPVHFIMLDSNIIIIIKSVLISDLHAAADSEINGKTYIVIIIY